MDVGLFLMPQAAPERSVKQTADFVLDVVREADQLGYREAWIGEHFACGWEPVPAPDLLIAQALRETEQIVLAPGAHVLPYHHPVELAHRVAYIDHLAQGRYMLGVGAGSVPMDADLFGCIEHNPDGSTRMRNIDMMREALSIMLKVWTSDEGFDHEGEFWKFRRQDWDEHEQGPWLKPYQRPHPPIGMAGISASSGTLAVAGRLGFPADEHEHRRQPLPGRALGHLRGAGQRRRSRRRPVAVAGVAAVRGGGHRRGGAASRQHR